MIPGKSDFVLMTKYPHKKSGKIPLFYQTYHRNVGIG
jgi:hypothetical protein